METQIFLSEETRAADPAVMRSEEWFEGFIVPTERQWRKTKQFGGQLCNTIFKRHIYFNSVRLTFY